jgi:hypothetical protein
LKPLHVLALSLLLAFPLAGIAQLPSGALEPTPARALLAEADPLPIPATGIAAPTPESEEALPSAPEPFASSSSATSEFGGFGSIHSRAPVEPAALYRMKRFTRMGVGFDIGPLGIGFKTAINLNHFFDLRATGYKFSYNSPQTNIDGFNAFAHLNLSSATTSLDYYPFGSILRISGGLQLYNGNEFSANSDVAPGTSFSLGNQTYYSDKADSATGSTPLVGSGKLGLHTNSVAPTVSFGFGSFVPRSERHWSFPSEFGVTFMGAPTVDVNVNGWVCLDSKLKNCSNIGDPTNQVTVQFNHDLQTQVAKWRKDVSVVTVYPILSYGVMYSFNIR